MPIPINPMWFEGRLPAFRRNPVIGGLVSAALVIVAIAIKLLLPTIPTLTILFPAILVSAWIRCQPGLPRLPCSRAER